MYLITNDGLIKRQSDLIYVDDDNEDYLAWIAEGNSPEREKPLSLSVSKPVLFSDGVDEVVLSIQGQQYEAVTVDILTGVTSSMQEVVLDDVGYAEVAFSCLTSFVKIRFSCQDAQAEVTVI